MSDPDTSKAGEVAYGFVKAFLKETGANVIKFLSKNRIGFLPPDMDYDIFQKIKRKAAFKQLNFLIGSHYTLPIVVVGLWIDSLPEDKKVKVIEDSRNDIYGKYGPKGVHILNVCTTGYMEKFIVFLTRLKIDKNMSHKELTDIYEEILENWEKLTIFVEKGTPAKHLIKNCEIKMVQGTRFFYMFAAYSALKVAEEVIRKLKNEIKGYGYRITADRLNPEGSRVVWIFEKKDIRMLDRSETRD